MSFGLPKGTHCLNPIRYHGASIENTCCHQPLSTMTQSIGILWLLSDLTHRSKPFLTLYKLNTSQSWESMQYSSLVNHDNWYLYVMIHRKPCPMCITYTSPLIMGNPSWLPRQVIPPIRRWCTIVSTRLPKSIN